MMIFMTKYFVGVINDVIFKILFSKFTLLNFYLIAFGEVVYSAYFGDSLYLNLLYNV